MLRVPPVPQIKNVNPDRMLRTILLAQTTTPNLTSFQGCHLFRLQQIRG